MLKHYDTFDIRKKLFGMISPDYDKYIVKDENYTKILLKYPRRKELRSQLRDKRRKFNNLKYSIKCNLSEHELRKTTTKM